MANPEHVEILKSGVEEWNRWVANNTIRPDLCGANLSGAHLVLANLRHCDLRGTDFRNAKLHGARFYKADLTEANLFEADLLGAHLGSAVVQNINLGYVSLSETVLSNLDLSTAKGLESCRHYGASILDHRTLLKSGKLPVEFLRGCGLPEVFIQNLPGMFWNNPIEFYSCFISYSHEDKSFAQRLHDQLQSRGIRCWLDEK